MNEFEWKAAQREAARQEIIKRAAADQKTAAEWCAAWFAMTKKLGLKEDQLC